MSRNAPFTMVDANWHKHNSDTHVRYITHDRRLFEIPIEAWKQHAENLFLASMELNSTWEKFLLELDYVNADNRNILHIERTSVDDIRIVIPDYFFTIRLNNDAQVEIIDMNNDDIAVFLMKKPHDAAVFVVSLLNSFIRTGM